MSAVVCYKQEKVDKDNIDVQPSLFTASDWLIFWCWGLCGGFEQWLQYRPSFDICTNIHGAWPGGQSVCLHLYKSGTVSDGDKTF